MRKFRDDPAISSCVPVILIPVVLFVPVFLVLAELDEANLDMGLIQGFVLGRSAKETVITSPEQGKRWCSRFVSVFRIRKPYQQTINLCETSFHNYFDTCHKSTVLWLIKMALEQYESPTPDLQHE
jgi:hypothetical protein